MPKRLSRKKIPGHELPAGQPNALPDEIERLAHDYWLERGRPIGSPEVDWFRAEEEVRRRERAKPGNSAPPATSGS